MFSWGKVSREKVWSTEPGRVLGLMITMSLVLCASITNQSLWIDEAVMAYFASYGEFANMLSVVINLRSSDPQMPLYILYLWGWAKIAGTSEYALRAANMPFAILLVAALGWTSWRALGRPVLWVLFCASPFVWFYMNEARPYIAIMACSAVSTGAIIAYFADRERYGKGTPWLCLSGLLIACALQMLSAFLVTSLICLAFFAIKEKHLAWNTVLCDWAPALLVHLPFFVALAAYFAWTLSVGAGGMRETPGLGNLGFAVYEFMGFMGLGPPRHVLRAERNLQVFMPYWPWLSIGLLSAATFVTLCVRQVLRQQPDHLRRLVISLLAGVSLFLLASTAANFRFWGRHLAVFFPLFSFVFIAGLGDLATERAWKNPGRVTVMVLLCVWLISDARLWALPQYHKDDYRLAVQVAVDVARRSNATILWAANDTAARYYAIEFDDALKSVGSRRHPKTTLAANWNQTQITEYLDSATAPAVLVLSKADLYDAAGTWTAAVDKLQPRKVVSPNAFNIYIFEPDNVRVRHSTDVIQPEAEAPA